MKFDRPTFKPFRFAGHWCSAIVLVAVSLSLLASVSSAQTDATATEDAVAVFNMGQDAHEKGELRSAIDYYQKALKLLPEFPEAAYQSGIAYRALGKTAEAEVSFRKAVELRPEWTLALTALGSLLVESGNYKEAGGFLSKAIELDEQNFPAIAAVAEMRLRTRAAPAELSDLLSRIEMLTTRATNPTASLWSARAALENALGKTASARSSVAKALAIDPKSRYALEVAVEIALADGDIVRAGESVATLEKTVPDAADIRLLRARVLVSEGKADEASRVLESLSADLPGVAELKTRLAAARSENGPELESLIKNDPKNVTALSRLCSIYRIGSPAKALEYCRLASEAEPGNIDHAVGFGAALVQAKQYESAVSLFRKLTAIAPDNSTAHANLATALFQLKRYPEAKIEFHWLTDHQPDLAAAYYFLGITHDQLAEYMDAMANYQQFLRRADPDKSKLEIEKVNLRLPILQKQLKGKK